MDTLALDEFTVLELADQRGEFLGKLLSGMGANVIKVEPPGGSPSRRIGPFYQDNPHPDRSLHYWHYNQGKKGVTLDIAARDGQELLKRLAAKADVLVETSRPQFMDELGLGYDSLREVNADIVMMSITDFGQTGPQKDYKGSDLVLLALGGIMMVSGYPPGPDGKYDTPPIAPQAWQTIHISNCMACFDLMGALWHRRMTGQGQFIDYSLHAAINSCTENWLSRYLTDGFISQRRPSFEGDTLTRDGFNMITMPPLFPGEWEREVEMLDRAGMADDLKDEKYSTPSGRAEHTQHIAQVRKAFVATQEADELFVSAQNQGVIWSPVRPPEGSLNDSHFVDRGNFAEVNHPELGKSFTYPGSPWVASAMPWRNGPRAPLLGEHNMEIYEGMLGLTRPQIVALAQAGIV